MGMVCPKCNKESDSKFCPHDGTKLVGEPIPEMIEYLEDGIKKGETFLEKNKDADPESKVGKSLATKRTKIVRMKSWLDCLSNLQEKLPLWDDFMEWIEDQPTAASA